MQPLSPPPLSSLPPRLLGPQRAEEQEGKYPSFISSLSFWDFLSLPQAWLLRERPPRPWCPLRGLDLLSPAGLPGAGVLPICLPLFPSHGRVFCSGVLVAFGGRRGEVFSLSSRTGVSGLVYSFYCLINSRTTVGVVPKSSLKWPNPIILSEFFWLCRSSHLCPFHMMLCWSLPPIV